MKPFRKISDWTERLGIGTDSATLRDAVRLALQSAIAAVATYFAMRGLGQEQFFVAILSAIMILAPSVGGTLDAAKTRVWASIIGSAVGLVCLFTLPAGFSTAFGLLVTMFLLNGAAVLKPNWSYGVVAAVALSIASGDDLVAAALARLNAIVIGVVVGLFVAMVVWPDTAAARFERHLEAALRSLRKTLGEVVAKGKVAEPDREIGGRAEARESIEQARGVIDAIALGDTGPRRKRVKAVDSVFDSIWLLSAVLERSGDLREEDVQEVLERFADAGRATLGVLAEGDAPPKEMDALDSATKAAQERLGETDLIDPRGGDQAEVIAFALGSIAEKLRELADTQPRPGEATPAWSDRISLRRRPG